LSWLFVVVFLWRTAIDELVDFVCSFHELEGRLSVESPAPPQIQPSSKQVHSKRRVGNSQAVSKWNDSPPSLT